MKEGGPFVSAEDYDRAPRACRCAVAATAPTGPRTSCSGSRTRATWRRMLWTAGLRRRARARPLQAPGARGLDGSARRASRPPLSARRWTRAHARSRRSSAPPRLIAAVATGAGPGRAAARSSRRSPPSSARTAARRTPAAPRRRRRGARARPARRASATRARPSRQPRSTSSAYSHCAGSKPPAASNASRRSSRNAPSAQGTSRGRVTGPSGPRSAAGRRGPGRAGRRRC